MAQSVISLPRRNSVASERSRHGLSCTHRTRFMSTRPSPRPHISANLQDASDCNTNNSSFTKTANGLDVLHGDSRRSASRSCCDISISCCDISIMPQCLALAGCCGPPQSSLAARTGCNQPDKTGEPCKGNEEKNFREDQVQPAQLATNREQETEYHQPFGQELHEC